MYVHNTYAATNSLKWSAYLNLLCFPCPVSEPKFVISIEFKNTHAGAGVGPTKTDTVNTVFAYDFLS